MARRIFSTDEERRAAKRAYEAAYRAANKEKVSARHRTYYLANKEKVLAYCASYRDAHREERRAKGRVYAAKYYNKVPLAGRPKPDRCEVCGRPPTKLGLVFDHCHQHGHFRGWLCTGCNSALGHVNDDVQILRKLIAYLQRNRTNTAPQLVLAGI